MKRIKKVVLTGGPCSGKSTAIRALREEFGDRLVLVPEAATILLEGGFPVPGRDVEWSEEWQSFFQAAVAELQKNLEKSYELIARKRDVGLMICDRGLLDGAAYTSGGIAKFCETHNLCEKEVNADYETIIHLKSLAEINPECYGKEGNEVRFESLERAQKLDRATLAAWKNHQRKILIQGERGIEGKITETIGIIRYMLAERTEN